MKRRFEAELKSPQFKGGLDDDMYARALKTFIDELQSAKYKVKDGRGTTVSDVSAVCRGRVHRQGLTGCGGGEVDGAFFGKNGRADERGCAGREGHTWLCCVH